MGSAILVWSLRYRQLQSNPFQSIDLNSQNQVGHERTICNYQQESNICDNFDEHSNTKTALEISGGDQSKFGPGARAKADANRPSKIRGSGSAYIPGAEGFVSQNPYCHYHENAPLSCKPKARLSDGQFQSNGDNNNPPPEYGQSSKRDMSSYKGGPNPFTDKFDYDNLAHSRENVDYSDQKHINHAYDRHAEKCFGMKQNRNKESLEIFKQKNQGYIKSSETERIDGSYRYQVPAYLYKQKDSNLVAIVDARDNSFIIVLNATKSQLENLRNTNNFGLDTRPSLELRLRGPKG